MKIRFLGTGAADWLGVDARRNPQKDQHIDRQHAAD